MYFKILTALVQIQLTARLLPNTPDNRLIVLEEIRDIWSADPGDTPWTDDEVAFLACTNVMIEIINLDKHFAL